MNPETIAKGKDESSQQIALFCWAALPETQRRYPELRWLYHVPNGGSRGNDARSAAIVGGKLKAEGVKAGVLDLALNVPRLQSQLDPSLWADKVTPFHGIVCGLKVEMKRPGAIKDTSKEQKEYIAIHSDMGYACVVADTYALARYYIEQYLGVRE